MKTMPDPKDLFFLGLLLLGIVLTVRGTETIYRLEGDISIFFGLLAMLISLARFSHLGSNPRGSLSLIDWALLGFCLLLIPACDLIGASPLQWTIFILYPVMAYKLIKRLREIRRY